MKKEIYIIGSGGFAKEVFGLIKAIDKYIVKGFISHKKEADVVFGNKNIPVIEEDVFINMVNKDISLAFGIGDPKILQKLSYKFQGYDFPNLFHPNVTGDFDNIKIGKGNIFTSNVTLTTCIKIGDFNVFNLLTTIGHDVIIGNFNVVNPSVNISGGVSIGNANLIGVSATILQYKQVGNNSIVGASSLVVKDVPDDVTVIGVPAKRMF